ncbi:MAG: hypothetical protein J5711_04030 [Bacteroidales bacterium]|nr:hypothetical protein [Bacteroidales bacterium]
MDKNEELRRLKQLLANYEELLTDCMDDSSYVARGNGFCDNKYSDDFIEGRIADIKQRIAELEKK